MTPFSNVKRTRDEQGVVVSWLVQITLVVAVVGIVLFDAGSIAWNYFGVDSTADDIAFKIAEKVDSGTLSGGLIEEEAKKLAKDSGARLVKGSLVVTPNEVRLEIRRDATTIVISRISAVEDWARATATGSAPFS